MGATSGARSTNTMSEVLTNMLRELSVAKTLPDSDLSFIVGLETSIITKLRAPIDAAAGQMPPGSMDPNMVPGQGGPGGGGLGPPPGPPPGPLGPPPGMMMGGGPPGLRQQPQGPSPDELQRLMAGSA